MIEAGREGETVEGRREGGRSKGGKMGAREREREWEDEKWTNLEVFFIN